MNDVTLRTLLSLKDQKRSLNLVFVGLDGLAPDLEHVSDRLFKKCIDLAGVKRIKFHNLRSSFAANFCMNGGDVYTLSKMLGHSTVEMTSRKYAHLHPSHLLKASHIVSFEADSEEGSPELAPNHLRVVESI